MKISYQPTSVLDTTRISRYTAVFGHKYLLSRGHLCYHPPPCLITWSNRKCCERTLATNCVPGYGWQATMALQDHLSKPEVRHYCYQRPLLCSTPAFCLLLCSTPAFVFNAPLLCSTARFCVQRPQGGRSHRHGEALLCSLLRRK